MFSTDFHQTFSPGIDLFKVSVFPKSSYWKLVLDETSHENKANDVDFFNIKKFTVTFTTEIRLQQDPHFEIIRSPQVFKRVLKTNRPQLSKLHYIAGVYDEFEKPPCQLLTWKHTSVFCSNCCLYFPRLL